MGRVSSHAVSRWSRSLGCCGFRGVFRVRRDFVFVGGEFLRTHSACCKREAALPHLPLFFLRLGVRVWDVSSCFVLPTRPRSLAVLVWVIWPLYSVAQETLSVFVGPGLGWFLRIFVLPTPSTQCRADLGNRANILWHRTIVFLCSFFLVLPTPLLSEPGAIWVTLLLIM